jgi:hypothetical protein
MSSLSARAQLESVVTRRFPTAIGSKQKPAPETIATGITQLDSVIGGIGRGTITELCGPVSSGRSTVLLSLLAQVTRRQEVSALVDVTDVFDAPSAAAVGIDLQQILWVRCKTKGPAVGETVERSLKTADLLSQSGGFSLVILDLADIPPRMMHHIPVHCWFRFRQAIENTPTALLVLGQESYAKTAASLVLRLQPLRAQWKAPLAAFDSSQPFRTIPSHALLLQGRSMEIQVERVRQASDPTVDRFSKLVVPSFEARTEWSAPAHTC